MVQERPVRVERRLSAILAADVAGYSRLMHNDEEATHAKLTALLADAVDARDCRTRRPHREEHRRRVLGGVSERGRSGSSCCAVPDPHSTNLQSVRRKTGALLSVWASISAT